MARQLFEIQAARRRNGDIANGAIYVVYSDIAGTTAADISATVDGASLSGSIVTTADIAGLGPGSAQFYGPPSGVDTLYIRSSSDATLGVQKIKADPDPRLDALETGGAHPNLAVHNTLGLATQAELDVVDDRLDDVEIVVHEGPLSVADPRVATVAGDAGDHALALQRAIELAQTSLVSGVTNVPSVFIPAGEYHWKSHVDWRTCSIIGDPSPYTGTLVLWDGTANATVMTKTTDAGGASFGQLRNIQFKRGTTEPGTWLDCSFLGVIDFFFRLEEVGFIGCTSYAIKLPEYVNCHWRHIRWDDCAACLLVTPGASANLGSFLLDGFTIDHARATGHGTRMFEIDSSGNTSNAGIFAVKNGRIEVNTDMDSPEAVLVLKVPDVGINPRSLGLYFENVTYKDVVGMSAPCLVYHNTAATTAVPSLILNNVRQEGLASIIAGGLSTSYPAIPLQGNYGYLAYNTQATSGGNDVMASALRLLSAGFGGDLAFALRRGTEANDRFQIDSAGSMLWGSGSAAGDVTLRRNNVDELKTDDTLVVAQHLFVDNAGNDRKIFFGGSADVTLYRSAADVLATDDDLAIITAGKGLKVKEGSNAKMGTATLVAGAATVATTAVTANSRIQVTSQVDGGTPGFLRVSTRTAGTSFVITSSSATDTSTVAWVILEPA